MAATPEQIQQLIMDEYGASNDTVLRRNIVILWELYGGDRLQELRVRERVLTYLQGQARSQVDVSRGQTRISANQSFRNLGEMVKNVRQEIEIQGGNAGRFAGQTPTNDFYTGVPQLEQEFAQLLNPSSKGF